MGYRGTRAQLEARLAALPAELEVMHEQLAEASREVEALREQQWGRLGVLWFRFTLRRVLRDVDARGRHDLRTTKGLRKAVERHERALAHGCDVLRWLEGSPDPEAVDPPRERAAPPSSSGVAPLGVLAVIGSAARNAWALMGPLLLVFGAVLSVAAAIGGDGDGVDEPDFDGFDNDAAARPMDPVERHAADIVIGGVVVGLAGLLAAGGVGVWWWLR